MSGAYVGDEVPFGVIADGFFAKGSQSQNLLTTIQQLLFTAQTRSSDHYRECAPAWVRVGVPACFCNEPDGRGCWGGS
jgi:hypothetical protein